MPGFYGGAGDLNSSPDAFSAGTLQTEPSSQLLHMEFKLCCSLSYKVKLTIIIYLT